MAQCLGRSGEAWPEARRCCLRVGHSRRVSSHVAPAPRQGRQESFMVSWIKLGETMNMIVRRWWNWYGTTKSFRTSPLGLRNPITCFPSSAFRCGCKPPVVLTYYMMTIFQCCNTHSEPWHPHFLNQMTGEIPIFSIKNPGELPLFNVGSATEDSLAAATVATFASLQTAARRGLHRSSPCPSSISPTKEWVQPTYINYPYELCESWCIMHIIYIYTLCIIYLY